MVFRIMGDSFFHEGLFSISIDFPLTLCYIIRKNGVINRDGQMIAGYRESLNLIS